MELPQILDGNGSMVDIGCWWGWQCNDMSLVFIHWVLAQHKGLPNEMHTALLVVGLFSASHDDSIQLPVCPSFMEALPCFSYALAMLGSSLNGPRGRWAKCSAISPTASNKPLYYCCLLIDLWRADETYCSAIPCSTCQRHTMYFVHSTSYIMIIMI